MSGSRDRVAARLSRLREQEHALRSRKFVDVLSQQVDRLLRLLLRFQICVGSNQDRLGKHRGGRYEAPDGPQVIRSFRIVLSAIVRRCAEVEDVVLNRRELFLEILEVCERSRVLGTLVLRRSTPKRLVLPDQPTPASRKARFSFSISRAITSRWIWFVPS